MIKIVHCADIHIGASFGRLPSALSSLRTEEQHKAFSDMINFCKEKQVDALLICGDLFDSPVPLKKDTEFIRKALTSLSPIPVFIIAGNHDYMSFDSPYLKDGYFSDNVHIFPAFDYSFEIHEKNAVIYGKSYNSTVADATFNDISPDEDKINIFCLHGDFSPSGDYTQIQESVLSGFSVNYAAMGHIHKGSIFSAGKVKCAYCGALEATGFDDDGQTGIIYAEITPEETTLTPVSFSKRNYHNISYNVSGEDTEKIISSLKEIVSENDLYKITLTGESAEEINEEFIRKALEPLCFYADIIDETSLSYDFDAIEKEDSLRGEFLRELRKLTQNEEDFILCGKVGLDSLSGKIPSWEVDV